MSSVGLPVVVRCLGALVARTHVWPLLHLIVPGPASPFSPCSSTWRVGPNPAAGFTAAELKQHLGLTVDELKEGGFSILEIKAAGFPPWLLTKAGVI